MGSCQVFPAGEQHQPSILSPAPFQQLPASSPVPSLSPLFPATDTAQGTGIYIKSRVYCHFYLDLHNSVTALDIKSNVPSHPREQARDREEPRSVGWLLHPTGWSPTWLVVLPSGQSRSSQRCHVVLSGGMPERSQPVPSLVPLAIVGCPLTGAHLQGCLQVPQLFRWALLTQSGHPTSSEAPFVHVFIHRTATEDAQTNKTSFFFSL